MHIVILRDNLSLTPSINMQLLAMNTCCVCGLFSDSRVSAFQEVSDTMITPSGEALPPNSGIMVADAQSDTVLSGSVGESNMPNQRYKRHPPQRVTG